MSRTKKNIVSISVVTALVIAFIGISYAYFTAGLSGQETASTIVVTGGRMTITYQNNSNNIIVENIYPREEAWVTKEFTVRGTNTTDLDMDYYLYLTVDNNSFPANALTCSLTGNSVTENQTMASATEVVIPASGDVALGSVAKFKTADNVDHVYTLKIFLKDNNINQNGSQNKTFAGHITITNGE